jgi:16S rRNA (guanine527-N7)-methyltransferase
MLEDPIRAFREALERSAPDYQIQLDADALGRLSTYFSLLNKWNHRLHLVAPCSPQQFATRHVLESLLLIHHLPSGSKVIDVGSGAGLPMVPCLIVRPDLSSTLIEASKKKTVFLKEALKETETRNRANLICERFENTPTLSADFVSCRALDRFRELLPTLITWSPRPVTLLLFGGQSLQTNLDEQQLGYSAERIPNSVQRFLFEVKLE